MGKRLRHQTEGSRDQEGDGSSRPRLRMAGNGVAHGNAIVRFAEAGKHLWQPVVRKVRRCFNNAREDAAGFGIATIATKASRYQSIIVRPYRAQVIPDGIVAPFLCGQGAHTPSR